MRTILALIAVLLAAAVAAGCGTVGSAVGETVEPDRKVRVTTSTNFITDVVERVGGDRVDVTALMGPGVDPHLYKASARDVRSLRRADVIFYGGLQLEGKMEDVLERLARQQRTVAITDVTDRFRKVGRLVAARDLAAASALLPDERPYPLPVAVAARVAATLT